MFIFRATFGMQPHVYSIFETLHLHITIPVACLIPWLPVWHLAAVEVHESGKTPSHTSHNLRSVTVPHSFSPLL